jgi:hypothetical protein
MSRDGRAGSVVRRKSRQVQTVAACLTKRLVDPVITQLEKKGINVEELISCGSLVDINGRLKILKLSKLEIKAIKKEYRRMKNREYAKAARKRTKEWEAGKAVFSAGRGREPDNLDTSSSSDEEFKMNSPRRLYQTRLQRRLASQEDAAAREAEVSDELGLSELGRLKELLPMLGEDLLRDLIGVSSIPSDPDAQSDTALAVTPAGTGDVLEMLEMSSLGMSCQPDEQVGLAHEELLDLDLDVLMAPLVQPWPQAQALLQVGQSSAPYQQQFEVGQHPRYTPSLWQQQLPLDTAEDPAISLELR